MCQAEGTKVQTPNGSPTKTQNKTTYVSVHCGYYGKPCVFILRPGRKIPKMYQPRRALISKIANLVYDQVLKGNWELRPNLLGEAGWVAWRVT